MSDSPAVIPYDQDGQPLATEPGTPADKALTVQGDPEGAPIAVSETHPIDVSGLATASAQSAQIAELAAIAAAVQGTLQVSGTVTSTPSGTQDVAVTNVAHVVIDAAPASLASETTLDAVKTALVSLDAKLINPLPVSGAVTVDTSNLAALQATGNASLASIDDKLDGPIDVSVSFPSVQDVAVMNVPHVVVDGTVTASIDTAALATTAKQDIGNTALASIDGKLTNPLPVTVDKTGLATTAGQATGNASLSSIDAKLPTLAAGKVPVDVAFPAVQPISVAALPLPAGSATETTLAALNTKTPTLGQAAMAASQPVVIASNQTAVPVSGSVTATLSGTPAVSVSNFPSTQPVSIASQPLPSGASSSALQTTGNTSLGNIDTKTPALVSGRVPVDGSGVVQPVSGTVTAAISGTPNVAVTSSALPAGAASETTLGTRLAEATFTARIPALGQATMAASSPVTIASNQSAIPVSGTVSAVVSGTTLTGGSQKAIVRGGAKGATAATDVTSTAEGTDHTALDVQLYHGGAAIDPQQIRALSSGTDSVTCVPSGTQAVSIAAAVPVTDGGGSLTVDGTVTTIPSGTQTVSGTVTANLGTLNGVATETTLSAISNKTPALGQATMAASQPVAIASNQSAIPVSGTLEVSNFPAVQSVNATLVNTGASMPLANGAATSALQTTGNTSLGNIETKTPTLVSGRVPVMSYDTAGNVITSPLTAAGTIASSTNTASLSLHGRTSVTVRFSASAFVATVAPMATVDGTTWLACYWIDLNPYGTDFGVPVFGEAFNISVSQSVHRAVVLPPGAQAVRLSTAGAYTSGSMTYTIAASNAAFPDFSYVGLFTRACSNSGSPFTSNLTTSSAQVLSANADRQMALFTNTGANTAYLCFGPYSASPSLFSVKLEPGQYYEMFSTVKGLYKGTIRAATGSGTTTLMIQQFI